MRLAFGILGPLSVSRDGAPVDLGPAKRRAVLSTLLLSANEYVSRDDLIAAIWDEQVPATAANVVQAHVSSLRTTLDPNRAPRLREGRIASVGTGYALRADRDELDLLRFADLVRSGHDLARHGDVEKSVAALGHGLSLWRGRCLTDVPLWGSARARIATVSEEWYQAVAGLASVSHQLGRPDLALPHLELAAEHSPLHEAVHAQLMIALAGTQRQDKALQIFDDLRRRLTDELGVDPSAGLFAARDHVVADVAGTYGAAADIPPVTAPLRRVPAQLPLVVSNFTGRGDELWRLDDAAFGSEPPASGGPRIGVITGGRGVGKTTLALHWAHRVANRFPDGQLYVDLGGQSVAPPPRSDAVAAQFLRALGIPAGLSDGAGNHAPRRLRQVMAGRRLLVILDNAADGDQVRPLLPADPGCYVIVTSRVTLPELAAADGACRIDLGPFKPEESAALLTRILGSGTPGRAAEAAALADLCDHSPLVLRVAAAHLTRNRHVTVGDLVERLRAGEPYSVLRIDDEPEMSLRPTA